MGKPAQQRRIKIRRDEARGGLSVEAWARKHDNRSKQQGAHLVRQGAKHRGPWKVK